MKNLKHALILGAIFALAIVGYFFMAKDPQKSTYQQDITAQSKNSFSVTKDPGKNQDGTTNVGDAIVERGKSYLLKQVDNRIGQLGPFKDKVEKTENLSESDRNDLVSEIDEAISTFETLKPEIIQCESKEDIKAVADKIKEAWLASRKTVEHAEGLLFVAKENQLLSDADNNSVGLQKRIDALKAGGKDAKQYEQMLSAYNQKIAAAKQNVESAKAKFAEAKDLKAAEKDKLIEENQKLLSDAQTDIKDAYRMIHEGAKKEFDQRFK